MMVQRAQDRSRAFRDRAPEDRVIADLVAGDQLEHLLHQTGDQFSEQIAGRRRVGVGQEPVDLRHCTDRLRGRSGRVRGIAMPSPISASSAPQRRM